MSRAPQKPYEPQKQKDEAAQQAGAGSGPDSDPMLGRFADFFSQYMQSGQSPFGGGPYGGSPFGGGPYGGPPFGGPPFGGAPFGGPPFGGAQFGGPPHHGHHYHMPWSLWPMPPWLMLWWPGLFSPFAMYLMMLQFAAARAHFWQRWFETMATTAYLSHPGQYWGRPYEVYPEPEDSPEFKYLRGQLKNFVDGIEEEHRPSASRIIDEMIYAYKMMRAMEVMRRGPWHRKPTGGYAWSSEW